MARRKGLTRTTAFRLSPLESYLIKFLAGHRSGSAVVRDALWHYAREVRRMDRKSFAKWLEDSAFPDLGPTVQAALREELARVDFSEAKEESFTPVGFTDDL